MVGFGDCAYILELWDGASVGGFTRRKKRGRVGFVLAYIPFWTILDASLSAWCDAVSDLVGCFVVGRESSGNCAYIE